MQLEKNDRKQFSPGPIGEFSEIEPFFDPARGDIMVDITQLEEWRAPEVKGGVDERKECRKVVNISMLFGPDKPSGPIGKFDIAEKLRNKKIKIFRRVKK